VLRLKGITWIARQGSAIELVAFQARRERVVRVVLAYCDYYYYYYYYYHCYYY